MHAIMGKKEGGHIVMHYKWDTEGMRWNMMGFGKERRVVDGYMDLGYRFVVVTTYMDYEDLLDFFKYLTQP